VPPLPFDPRLLDPRLWLRAFEDLHTLSEAAVIALEDLHRMATLAQDLRDRIDEIDARAAQLLHAAEEIRDSLPLARELLDAAQVLGTAGTTMAAAVEPLQGITERLGRIADRLPGARRARDTP
jgi:cell division septum initiation protein DivIVA